jgi:hypothetical protein
VFSLLFADDSGGLAQLGEHLLCKQGVVGSIPTTSTKIQSFLSQEFKVKRISAAFAFDRLINWLFDL